MKAIHRLTLVAALTIVGSSVHAIEANFKADFLVYSGPGHTPTLAYEVPSGANLSYFTGFEVADDVTLSGTDRVIAGVNFEYYANYALSGGLTFRIYGRTEAGAPGDLLYSTPLDILEGGGLVNIAFNFDATNVLPQRFYYSVQFEDVEQGNVAGMIVPDQKATKGFSSDQLLEKRGNSWLPVNLTADRELRLGLSRDEDKLLLWIVATPNTLVKVESGDELGQTWTQVAEVETDEGGYGEYEEDLNGRDIVFFRTIAP